LHGARLASLLVRRGLSEAALGLLTGYTPESIRRFIERPEGAPEAFALVAEVALGLKPGRLKRET
jgi:lambda repressor-like predicted transcriptional regulator